MNRFRRQEFDLQLGVLRRNPQRLVALGLHFPQVSRGLPLEYRLGLEGIQE